MRQKFGGARAADDADDLVALLEQQLGEIRAVLAGDAGDDRAFGHACSRVALRASNSRGLGVASTLAPRASEAQGRSNSSGVKAENVPPATPFSTFRVSTTSGNRRTMSS